MSFLDNVQYGHDPRFRFRSIGPFTEILRLSLLEWFDPARNRFMISPSSNTNLRKIKDIEVNKGRIDFVIFLTKRITIVNSLLCRKRLFLNIMFNRTPNKKLVPKTLYMNVLQLFYHISPGYVESGSKGIRMYLNHVMFWFFNCNRVMLINLIPVFLKISYFLRVPIFL